MSLLLITKRGTERKLVDEEINVNWAGDKFKEFQEETKEFIFFQKKKKNSYFISQRNSKKISRKS